MIKPNTYAVITNDPHCAQADRGRLVRVIRRNDDASPEADHEWLCQSVAGLPLAHSAGTVDNGGVAIPVDFLRQARKEEIVLMLGAQ